MNLYTYKILAFDNYDGDSFDLTLDLGFDIHIHKKVRIRGIDTPELRGGTKISKAAAKLARDWARTFVKESTCHFVSENYTGKFGRPLGDIVADNGVSLRGFLIDNNLGVPYAGQAKADIQHLHEANFQILLDRGELADAFAAMEKE